MRTFDLREAAQFLRLHPETLRLLREAGVPRLRTDRLGAVVWQTDGRQIRVRTYATDR